MKMLNIFCRYCDKECDSRCLDSAPHTHTHWVIMNIRKHMEVGCDMSILILSDSVFVENVNFIFNFHQLLFMNNKLIYLTFTSMQIN